MGAREGARGIWSPCCFPFGLRQVDLRNEPGRPPHQDWEQCLGHLLWEGQGDGHLDRLSGRVIAICVQVSPSHVVFPDEAGSWVPVCGCSRAPHWPEPRVHTSPWRLAGQLGQCWRGLRHQDTLFTGEEQSASPGG